MSKLGYLTASQQIFRSSNFLLMAVLVDLLVVTVYVLHTQTTEYRSTVFVVLLICSQCSVLRFDPWWQCPHAGRCCPCTRARFGSLGPGRHRVAFSATRRLRGSTLCKRPALFSDKTNRSDWTPRLSNQEEQWFMASCKTNTVGASFLSSLIQNQSSDA